MEVNWRRSPLAEMLDRLGRGVLMLALGIGWFTWLWGLNWLSMLAGVALGILLLLLRHCYRQMTLTRREKALRARIGGALYLEETLLCEAREAHERAARLLMKRWPLTLVEVTADGALCRQETELLLIQCLRMTAQSELSVSQLVDAYRAMRRQQANRAVVCVLGKTSARVAAQAEEMPVPVSIVRRETMLTLAGKCFPATNEQLVRLGERKRRVQQRGSLLRIMTQREKARRYWGYGVFLLAMYVISGSTWYALPGVICLTLVVVCRSGHAEGEKL